MTTVSAILLVYSALMVTRRAILPAQFDRGVLSSAQSFDQSFGQSFDQSFGHSFDQSFGHSFEQSFGHSFDQSFD